MGPTSDDLRHLQGDLGRAEYRVFLRQLQAVGEFPRDLPDWSAVGDRMATGGWKAASKDAILRPLLLRRDDPRVRTILLVLFWKPLAALYLSRRRWDLRTGTFWGDLCWHFIEAVHRIDLSQRSARYGQKIINDTRKHVSKQYARDEWGHDSLDYDEAPVLVDVDAMFALEAAELRCDRQRLSVKYHRLHAAGVIDEEELRVLVATRVLGWTLATFADHTELSVGACKKRRQRVEARIPHSEALF